MEEGEGCDNNTWGPASIGLMISMAINAIALCAGAWACRNSRSSREHKVDVRYKEDTKSPDGGTKVIRAKVNATIVFNQEDNNNAGTVQLKGSKGGDSSSAAGALGSGLSAASSAISSGGNLSIKNAGSSTVVKHALGVIVGEDRYKKNESLVELVRAVENPEGSAARDKFAGAVSSVMAKRKASLSIDGASAPRIEELPEDIESKAGRDTPSDSIERKAADAAETKAADSREEIDASKIARLKELALAKIAASLNPSAAAGALDPELAGAGAGRDGSGPRVSLSDVDVSESAGEGKDSKASAAEAAESSSAASSAPDHPEDSSAGGADILSEVVGIDEGAAVLGEQGNSDL